MRINQHEISQYGKVNIIYREKLIEDFHSPWYSYDI